LTEAVRIAIGFDFTCEAAELLVSSGFRIISERGGGWTDESYKAVTDAIPWPNQ
jgi:hypothetical protein